MRDTRKCCVETNVVSGIQIAEPLASYQVETGPERNMSQIMCFAITYSCTSHLNYNVTFKWQATYSPKYHSIVSILSVFQYKPAHWSNGRVSALKLVGCGFDPRLDQKTVKNGPRCLLAWHSVFGVGIWGLDHPMILWCGTAAAHCSPLENDGPTDLWDVTITGTTLMKLT